MSKLGDALNRWDAYRPVLSDGARDDLAPMAEAARMVDNPDIAAAVKAQTDKLMEAYVIFRNPEQGGSELERYEVVEMLEWSMSDALAAALTPQGDDS